MKEIQSFAHNQILLEIRATIRLTDAPFHMRTSIHFLVILLISTFLLPAQESLTGITVDRETNLPIPYVNIGIPLKNTGTVSDAAGYFTLKLDKTYLTDTLVFTLLGYESLHLPISTITTGEPIMLTPKTYSLSQVEITGEKTKLTTVGNTSTARNVILELGGNDLGNELGSLIRIKQQETMIETFQVNIVKNPYAKVRFRLNIYDVKGETPHESILHENIIVEFKKSKGMLLVDLSAYHIVVHNDFIVSLEWIEDLGKKPISFSASRSGPPVVVRKVSQGMWNKINIVSIGFHLDIRI